MNGARVIVMGIAGSGKSTIGRLLAGEIDALYLEADNYHPPANIQKMNQGIPLTDQDRWPWLEALGQRIGAPRAGAVVGTCSALKRSYRDLLRTHCPEVQFVHLLVDEATARVRVTRRPGHFMPESLVPSQLDTLEPLTVTEAGVVVDACQPPDRIIAELLAKIA